MPGYWTPHARASARERTLEMWKEAATPDDHPLRLARLAADMTQRDLAAATGVAADTISNVERRRHRPHTATAAVLAAALGLDPSTIR